MRSFLYRRLAALINQQLAAQPAVLSALKPLVGSCIAVEVEDWPLTTYVVVQATGIALETCYLDPPTTRVAGRLLDLLSLAYHRGDAAALFDVKLTISGNTEALTTLRDALSGLAIDWEAALATSLGPLYHPVVAKALCWIKKQGQRACRSAGETVQDYVQFESGCLPPKTAIEGFMTEVDKLRDDLERLSLHIDQCQARVDALC